MVKMQAKEKAQQLVNKFQSGYTTKEGFSYQLNIDFTEAKQCAIIAVDEILKAVHIAQTEIDEYRQYWQQVKTEINNL